jgi:hypothetical protein
MSFFKSLQGVQPLVLGVNPGEYGGLGSKPRLLYKAIKEKQIETKHIIFCDCFDLVFAVHPDELFDNYLSYKSPFVISAEKNCFPDTLKAEYDALPDEGIPYKYLNSGMICAETEAMLKVLEDIDAPNIPNDYWSAEKNCMINPNDQEYYQQSFLRQPVPMKLDRLQILCNTLHSVELEEFDFTGERIYNTVTDTYPCSFHLNGGAKTGPCREPILKHLNLI